MDLLNQALNAHRGGMLKDAEVLYRNVIADNPQNFDAVHMLGVLCSQNGNYSEAEKLFQKALTIDAKYPPCFHNYGLLLIKLKLFDQAIANFDKAIAIAPNYPPLHSDRGNALLELGRLNEALVSHNKAVALSQSAPSLFYNRANTLAKQHSHSAALQDYDRAIQLNGGYADAHNGRGNVLLVLKRMDESLAAFDRALALRPQLADAWNGRGNVFLKLRRFDEALAAYDKALAFNPELADAWAGRGGVFFEFKRSDEALAAYDKAVAFKPRLAEAWNGRGNVLLELRRYDEALAAYDKALSLDPDLAEAWLGRGNVHCDLERSDEALAAYDQALVLHSDLAGVWLGRGNVLCNLNRYGEALAAYDKALAVEPEFADAHFGKSLANLSSGNFEDGWGLYEWRSKSRDNMAFLSHLTGMNTSTRLDRAALIGKTVAVLPEQGVGDEIMFASILPDLIRDAKAVTCEVDGRLVGLFSTAFPRATFLPRGSSEHLRRQTFDVVLQAASLAHAYRRSAASFPRLPYLTAEAGRVDKWKAVLASYGDARLKIGISWRGGTDKTRRRARSVDLEQLSSVIERDDCLFVSLQYGDVKDEIARFNATRTHTVHSPLDDFSNFDDFAGLISALDLVISVQNTTIHMCGALGRPCWGMIPWRPEWRYGQSGDKMVWYSSVELFRQAMPNDWSGLIGEIGSRLTRKLAAGNAA